MATEAEAKIDQGGFAFPTPEIRAPNGSVLSAGQDGMSLRDYFAIHADVPWNAVIETLSLRGNDRPTIREMVAYRAQLKYIEADEMLKARKVGA